MTKFVRKFSDDQIAEARRMNLRRVPWAEIGAHFGVRGDIIRRHAQRGYRERMNLQATDSWGNRHGTKWSDEDAAKLVQLRFENWNWDYVVAQFPGRSKQACYVQYHYQTKGRPHYAPVSVDARQAPPVSLTSRSDLTGIICGDPAPGRSALESYVPPHARRRITLARVSMGASA